MQSLSTIGYLEVAPLLPASVALTYIAFVRFDWESSINRRFMRRIRNSDQKEFTSQSLLPVDKSPSRSLKPKQKTFRSHIFNAALPIPHINLTVGRLWGVGRSKRVSINLCAIQLALIVAEYALDGLRHRDWKRGNLLLLGIAWCDMTIYTTSAVTVVHLLQRGEQIKADRPDGTYHFSLALIVAFGQSITAATFVAIVAYMVREFY